jgi:ADP-ribose pyrophosphatase
MSISTETCIERKEIMKGHVLHVTVDKVSIDDGQGGAQTTSTREVVWHNGACAIVPVTDDGKIILVRQYRYAAALAMLEYRLVRSSTTVNRLISALPASSKKKRALKPGT